MIHSHAGIFFINGPSPPNSKFLSLGVKLRSPRAKLELLWLNQKRKKSIPIRIILKLLSDLTVHGFPELRFYQDLLKW